MLSTRISKSVFTATALLVAVTAADAQDLAITNARILDGTGGIRTIDANGRTVMPGFVEAHRHIIDGDPAAWLEQQAADQMQQFLEAGFTTVLSAIDAPQLLEARQRIEQGDMQGPRILAAAFVPLAGPMPGSENQPEGDPARFDASRRQRPSQAAPAIPREATINAIENAAQAGYDYLKTVIIVTPGGPEVETLKLVVEEGRRRGLPTITHAVSVQDTLAAIEAGPASLVHTPHIGHLGDDPVALQKIAAAGIPMMSTLAVFIPHFDADNEPLFRDGLPFPWDTLSSGGQGPVNARLLWEAGLTSYGYGTDTSWPPKESLVDELRALRSVFSPTDVVSIITKNAAEAALKADELGTLEAGKLADIVLVDGDPLEASSALLNVVTTIKGGEVVFER